MSITSTCHVLSSRARGNVFVYQMDVMDMVDVTGPLLWSVAPLIRPNSGR
jgi:hypothetical protein